MEVLVRVELRDTGTVLWDSIAATAACCVIGKGSRAVTGSRGLTCDNNLRIKSVFQGGGILEAAARLGATEVTAGVGGG